jgi:hypothetical protein
MQILVKFSKLMQILVSLKLYFLSLLTEGTADYKSILTPTMNHSI